MADPTPLECLIASDINLGGNGDTFVTGIDIINLGGDTYVIEYTSAAGSVVQGTPFTVGAGTDTNTFPINIRVVNTGGDTFAVRYTDHTGAEVTTSSFVIPIAFTCSDVLACLDDTVSTDGTVDIAPLGVANGRDLSVKVDDTHGALGAPGAKVTPQAFFDFIIPCLFEVDSVVWTTSIGDKESAILTPPAGFTFADIVGAPLWTVEDLSAASFDIDEVEDNGVGGIVVHYSGSETVTGGHRGEIFFRKSKI